MKLSRSDYAIVLCVVILALVARMLPAPRNVDDSFITFRYSRNIVEGNGFVYNVGERVLGTTTPLFTLIMAGVSFLTGGEEFPWYALTISALADATTCVLLFLLMRRLTGSRWAGALIGVLWAISPMSVTFAVGGMETSVNILWIVLATYLYVEDRPAWVGVAAGLGLLTRIDAALWIAPLFLYQLVESWRKERRLPLRTWIAFVLTIAPWFAFSQFYFGSLLSRSLSAKSVAYLIEPLHALKTLLPRYSTPFFEFETFGSIGAMLGAVIYLLLSVIGILYIARRLPRLLPFVFYAWVYFLVFSIANPLIFRWYLAPPMPALMFGIVAGVCAILNPQRRGGLQVVFTAISLLWIFTSISGWTLHPDHGPDRPAPKMAWHQIELLYQQIATQLREKYGVNETTLVASADIGAVGYFSRARILDTVGLVSPQATTYYPLPRDLIAEGMNLAIPPALILENQPAFLVTMEGFVRLGLEKDATFKQEYGDPVEVIPFEFYGTDMRVYQRRQ
ncbi:MAG: glycosyltransferase family 39 protein [Anaerolineae bacterium]|nr:glycosyltransferase family 39 protein [Anaerolineae bacterium]